MKKGTLIAIPGITIMILSSQFSLSVCSLYVLVVGKRYHRDFSRFRVLSMGR